jgi:hypothetical protein
MCRIEWVRVAHFLATCFASTFSNRQFISVTKIAIHLLQELCSEIMMQLGEAGFPSEAFSVYNMLRYGKRTVCKSLHEKVLCILVPAGLLKDAYVVVKVLYLCNSVLTSLLLPCSL